MSATHADDKSPELKFILDGMTQMLRGNFSARLPREWTGTGGKICATFNELADLKEAMAGEFGRLCREVATEGKLGGQALVPGAVGSWKAITDNVNLLASNLTTQVRSLAGVAGSVARGDLSCSISQDARGEVGDLRETVNKMIANLRISTQKDADQVWLKTNLARFALMLQGQTDLGAVLDTILTELSRVVAAQHGVFYVADASGGGEIRLKMLSSFAYQPRQDLPREFALGEGLVGQCAKDKRRFLLESPPSNYIKISSGLGQEKPAAIVVLPILFENRLKGVLEVASFNNFSPSQIDFLEQLMEAIGIVLNTVEANAHTAVLLKSLQAQQEELRRSNQALEEKADQLALTSKYKSEFLSNMSHELRTPLNSMLILSQQLAEEAGNLTDKQVEYAKTIHAAGGDLLSLINDILDLSKVESGTLALDIADLGFSDLRTHLDRIFRPLAERKGLDFSIEFDPLELDTIHTDGKRLEQILRNMLSNAFKFTEKGSVALTIKTVQGGWTPDHPVLGRAPSVVAFTVTDTGIGIPDDKQRIIFEAFQQADSGTTRKYGGTGLGLSISRELAGLLGCQLRLAGSTPGTGSAFVLYVPTGGVEPSTGVAAEDPTPHAGGKVPPAAVTGNARANVGTHSAALKDDRQDIHPGDVVLLIVEDDPAFAGVILEGARRNGFKGVVAQSGRSALELAEALKPDAVTLDLRLPDMDGWGVLSRFKNDLATRHVPIQVIAAEDDISQGIKEGAMAFLAKPISRAELSQALEALRVLRSRAGKKLLVLCPDEFRCAALNELLAGPDVQVTMAKNARTALAALRHDQFDCMVMELPGEESLAVLQVLEQDMAWTHFPIVAHLRDEMSEKDAASFEHASRAIPVKAVKSMERLLDDTALHLHRVISGMAPEKRTVIESLYQWTPVLSDKKALVVDDDVRNIFAMTSLLENYRMKVMSAENGADALALLGRNADIDVVLMDIMMPKMDGYDTMRAIRKDARFKTLPIIAVTAKAMKGDREKCIAAGASGYITKPVDTHHLLSLLRQWILR